MDIVLQLSASLCFPPMRTLVKMVRHGMSECMESFSLVYVGQLQDRLEKRGRMVPEGILVDADVKLCIDVFFLQQFILDNN